MKVVLIIISIILFIFCQPAIAVLTRDWANKKKWFLQKFYWCFLSDNIYGDRDWRPKLKGFWREYLWVLRNPLQNLYWKDYVRGKSSNLRGTVRYKMNGLKFGQWRTGRYIETGNHHGKIIDFKNSPFGEGDIEFDWVDENGNKKVLYRKSKCIPRRLLWWIYFHKRRKGYEHGLMQRAFSWHFRLYKLNKEGWKLWKNTEWKEEIR